MPPVPRALLVLVALVGMPTGSARAQDAGPPPGAPAVCGTLDARGACFGAVAAWCSVENVDGGASDAEVVSVDCAGVAPDGACVVLDGFGAWCALPDGSPCTTRGAAGRAQWACGPVDGGAASSGACDLVEGCVAAPVPCAAGCVDDRLVVGCSAFGQALTTSCAALGGACAEGACAGLPEGAACDGARFLCADGLSCAPFDAGPAQGACLAPGTEASRSPPEEPAPLSPPPPSCAASTTTAGTSPAAALSALLALVCALRRR